MMDETKFQTLIEARHQRPLTAEERFALDAYLATRPTERALWEDEVALDEALDRLPDAPVPSNFFSGICAAIDRSERTADRRPRFGWPAFRWASLLRPAGMAAGLCFALVIGHHQLLLNDRARVVESVEQVTLLAGVPSVEILRDFEVINGLRFLAASGDAELLEALERDR